MASVGTLRPIGLRRRLTLTLGLDVQHAIHYPNYLNHEVA